ncbi:MAG: hypothetical protein U5L04_00855 [Trueperaceae bacterium]|nr:hypothetical protein [Trueperaceae bacterium]
MSQPAIPQPSDLSNQRDVRFDGRGYELSKNDFALSDRALAEVLHAQAQGMYRTYLAMRDAPEYERLEPYVNYFADDALRTSLETFGDASKARYEQEGRGEAELLELRHILHDLRGGAMTALIGNAQLVAMEGLEPDFLLDMVMLARDHAKMMRSAIYDLDPDTREAEERFRRHTIVDIVERWQKRRYPADGRTVAVVVDSSYRGDISTRCLERSSLDRVIYNHVNNAVANTAGDRVQLSIAAGADLVRFTVENSITDEQQAFLERYADGNFRALYQGGVTQRGHGVGLSVCAELVGASVGLLPDEALKQGYLGALIHDNIYYAWFHWPRYDDAGTDPGDASASGAND